MCSNVKGLFKRILPFFATFAVGLFIASFFVQVGPPRFNFRAKGWERHKMSEQIQRENDRLTFENDQVRRENGQLKLENLRLKNESGAKHDRTDRFVMEERIPRTVEMPIDIPPPPAPQPPVGR